MQSFFLTQGGDYHVFLMELNYSINPIFTPIGATGHLVITDNGTNLSVGEMAKFCGENNIRLDLASVAHPQSNGQAERANQEIGRAHV